MRVTLSNVDESDSYTSPLIVKPGIVHVYSARHGGSLSIYNSAGCVMHSMLVDVADQPVRIDTSLLPAGVYAVVLDGAWVGSFVAFK